MLLEFGSRGWLRIGACLCAVLASACDGFDERLLRPAPTPLPRADAGQLPDASAPDGDPDGGPIMSDGGVTLECVQDLPTCTRAHALTACVEGACLLVACEGEYVDCDGEARNGCEATLASLEHCGLCGAACALTHAEASCQTGACEFVRCASGFGDCDGEPGNGCEVALDTIADCGACAEACPALDNAAQGCNAGACGVGVCLGPFGDCDAQSGNGCEEPLRSNAHCGGCELECAPANATGDCAGGSCAIVACQGEHVDCNGLSGDGCEATLDGVLHCGACGAACELANATAVRCTGQPLGCAVDHACTSAGCAPDAPENGCVFGYGDCDALGANGCETPLDSLTDCGACGSECEVPNGISACLDGACEFQGCEPGFDACTSAACLSLATDADHCGACNAACDGGTPNCAGGECTGQICAAGSADCNGLGTDGCEASLNAPTRCGLCDLSCGPYAHATASCSSGRCALGGCDAGYRDCDGALSNGCEVDIRTLEACGACGQTCTLPFAEESCATGSCVLVDCDPERANCDGNAANGCETSTLLPDHCGACDNDCRGRPHVLSAGCAEGACEFVCEVGYGNCDGEVDNGCEADFDVAANCGGCGNDCGDLPHVNTASCDGTFCDDLVCDPGWDDCDGNPENGCERRIDTLSDCGGCDMPCAPAHATGACIFGGCGIGICDGGYADCNLNAADGCEASFNAPETCGSCSKACADGLACSNGECRCTADAQCGHASFDCCTGVCTNTNSVCSLWPCPVPSTARPQQNCGACGTTCPFFCCGALGE